MQPFDANLLTRLQATQESTMQDTCVILKWRELDTTQYGRKRHQYEAYTTSACGFDPTATREVMDGTQVAVTDGTLRLPIALHKEIDQLDRVRITHRFGVALNDPPTYELIGLPQRGPSGLILNLRLVTDGSDT